MQLVHTEEVTRTYYDTTRVQCCRAACPATPCNSRHEGRGTPDGQDCSQTAADVEASTTATVIAGLRWRLRRRETLEHPKVLSELRKLEEQIADQLAQPDRTPGRHRSTVSTVGTAISQQISDAAGFDLKPDPLQATTPAEFIEALRQ
jgi:hypothetical protein